MRILTFTDIHFGRKGNSRTHNKDCIEFIYWAMKLGKEQECSYAAFLGDWHEDRSRIDSRTFNYSQYALEYINRQDWLKKMWFLIGNHDLFYRHNRDVHSIPHANPLEKIEVIKEPKIEGDFLFLPYIFEHEYDKHLVNTDAKYVFGHLELRDFIITGSNYRLKAGVDGCKYKNPDYIFSGHFHKRQAKDNIVYIGNCFPMDFGDAGDSSRGAMVLDTELKGDDRIQFFDWEDCPKYIKVTLSNLLESPTKFLSPKSRVRCLTDIEISYEEAIYIKEKFIKDYKLREFQLEDAEAEEIREALQDNDNANKEIELTNMNEIILEMLSEVSAPSINNDTLQRLYREL